MHNTKIIFDIKAVARDVISNIWMSVSIIHKTVWRSSETWNDFKTKNVWKRLCFMQHKSREDKSRIPRIKSRLQELAMIELSLQTRNLKSFNGISIIILHFVLHFYHFSSQLFQISAIRLTTKLYKRVLLSNLPLRFTNSRFSL